MKAPRFGLVDALQAGAVPGAARPGATEVERLVEAIGLPIGRWDSAYRLTFCNNSYALWAGRPREAIYGHTLEQLYGPDAWQAAQRAFADAMTGSTVSYDRLLTHQAGPPRWARVHAFPEFGADGCVHEIYTIAFDIHEDVLLREELQQAQRRLDRFTENIPYPLTYVDRDFVLRFVNRAYTQATGMRVEDLLGRPIGEVRGARRWAEHRPYFERALAGEACEYTRLTDLAHLGPRWVRTTYSPDCDDHGRVVGIYTTTVDVHELTLAQQALRRSVERDVLTDVLSRRALTDWIELAVARCHDEPVALYFIDLDEFKQINDSRGHRAGDAALVAVARSMQAAVRGADALGRFGGDEFVVAARLPERGAALTLAAHLLDAVRDCRLDSEGPRLTASIGYALAPGDATDTLELMRRADDAMYAAKKAGGNRALHCSEAVRG